MSGKKLKKLSTMQRAKKRMKKDPVFQMQALLCALKDTPAVDRILRWFD